MNNIKIYLLQFLRNINPLLPAHSRYLWLVSSSTPHSILLYIEYQSRSYEGFYRVIQYFQDLSPLQSPIGTILYLIMSIVTSRSGLISVSVDDALDFFSFVSLSVGKTPCPLLQILDWTPPSDHFTSNLYYMVIYQSTFNFFSSYEFLADIRQTNQLADLCHL